MALWLVDMEDPADPYGEGAGFGLEVRADSVKEARRKVMAVWRQHPYNKGNRYGKYQPFKVHAIKQTAMVW